ncbi:MAG: histidine phosphatase family protein, partial [Rhodobacterales bacterium]
GDCATQRNLNAQGRAQARRMGEALRKAGITFDHVWCSGWCRAYDTAVLMDMGQVAVRLFLDSFSQDAEMLHHRPKQPGMRWRLCRWTKMF